MRVLHISGGQIYGEVEAALVTFARERRSCPDMRPHFAVCFEGRFSRELRATGAPVDYLGNVRTGNPFTIVNARGALDRLLAEETIDVAVCHRVWAEAIFGPVIRKRKIPVAFWSHGFGLRGGQKWLEYWAGFTAPDLIICSSKMIEDSAKKLYPNVSAARVAHPVAPPPFAIQRENNPVKTIIVQASPMERGNGHIPHLEALAQIKDMPGWVCWFAGGARNEKEGAYLQKLHDACKAMGIQDRVEFLGPRDDVYDLFGEANIFCQPNLSPEPFGTVFVEALYSGLPVVTTDMGAGSEIVTPACGMLVPVNDPGALSRALRELVGDQELRAGLSAAGPARGAALCDPVRQLDTLRQILQALL